MMINALHLLWIIPVSVWFGFMIFAILTMGKDDTNNTDGENNT